MLTYIYTLCTAYKPTVQTEQTIDVYYHTYKSRSRAIIWQWNIHIHGTVVANTESWVFFYTFLRKHFVLKPTHKCYRVILTFQLSISNMAEQFVSGRKQIALTPPK